MLSLHTQTHIQPHRNTYNLTDTHTKNKASVKWKGSEPSEFYFPEGLKDRLLYRLKREVRWTEIKARSILTMARRWLYE